MSDNVGLSTPRGSGTSGYVQRNLSHLKPRDQAAPYPKDRDEYKYRQRLPDKDILEHDAKLKIENEVLKYQDELEEKLENGEDPDLTDDIIEEKVDAYRKKLEAERLSSKGSKGSARGLKSHQVHELGQAKIEEMENMRKALGIRHDYEEGGHWKEKEQRLRERGEREEEEYREKRDR